MQAKKGYFVRKVKSYCYHFDSNTLCQKKKKKNTSNIFKAQGKKDMNQRFYTQLTFKSKDSKVSST